MSTWSLPEAPGAGRDLDERLRAVLDFEREWLASRMVPAKSRAVRERFGVSAARYHQMLNRAIDLPQALAYQPMLVQRLRRLRESRRRARIARRLGLPGAPG